jgi:hypothetical protein
MSVIFVVRQSGQAAARLHVRAQKRGAREALIAEWTLMSRVGHEAAIFNVPRQNVDTRLDKVATWTVGQICMVFEDLERATLLLTVWTLGVAGRNFTFLRWWGWRDKNSFWNSMALLRRALGCFILEIRLHVVGAGHFWHLSAIVEV